MQFHIIVGTRTKLLQMRRGWAFILFSFGACLYPQSLKPHNHIETMTTDIEIYIESFQK